ncbi:hypothetical protein J6590_008045 [Homalodisca vitripennis]|nr:hypothetical protein J6590_008045 [Homalodisca vitripennis]
MDVTGRPCHFEELHSMAELRKELAKLIVCYFHTSFSRKHSIPLVGMHKLATVQASRLAAGISPVAAVATEQHDKQFPVTHH